VKLTLREEHSLRVFENRVVRGIFGPNRDEVTGQWRKLHNELNDMYSSPNIFWVIKWRMRWAGHVAGMGKRRGAYKFWLGHLRERGHFEDPGVDGRVIIKMDIQEVG